MQATGDRIIYKDGDTIITDQAAKFGAHTYPLNQIQSASMTRRWANGAVGWAGVGIGLLILIVGYIVWDGVFLTPMAAGCALIVGGLALAFLASKRYVVQLTSSDGKVATLEMPTRSEAQHILDLINKDGER